MTHVGKADHFDDLLTNCPDGDINVLVLVKGTERYVFLYGDRQRSDMKRALGRFASNPALSFSWYDAAVLSQRMKP